MVHNIISLAKFGKYGGQGFYKFVRKLVAGETCLQYLYIFFETFVMSFLKITGKF